MKCILYRTYSFKVKNQYHCLPQTTNFILYCFFQLKSIPVFQFKSIPFDLKDKGIPLLIGVPQSGEEPGNDFL